MTFLEHGILFAVGKSELHKLLYSNTIPIMHQVRAACSLPHVNVVGIVGGA